MQYTKLPIGIIPKGLWETERLEELTKAISRYFNDVQLIPIEWIKEYNELIIKYGNMIRG